MSRGLAGLSPSDSSPPRPTFVPRGLQSTSRSSCLANLPQHPEARGLLFPARACHGWTDTHTGSGPWGHTHLSSELHRFFKRASHRRDFSRF